MVIGIIDDAICINVATFQFIEETIHWWDCTLVASPLEGLTWSTFKKLFLECYFPKAACTVKRMEFFSNMTVIEHEI